MDRQWPQPLFLAGSRNVAVLLLHAYTGSSTDMRLLAQALNRQGYSVLVPQFRGHATADPLNILMMGSPAAWWQDTLKAIADLQHRGYQRIACFGLSLGGIFAAKAVLTQASVIAGGTISAPIFTDDFSRIPKQFIHYAQKIDQLVGRDTYQQQRELQLIQQLLPQQLADVQSLTRQLQPKMALIQKPFLVAQGGCDELIDPQAGRRLAKQIPAQWLTFCWYPEAGHVLTVNQAHQQLGQDITSFLDKLK
ncbi:alpha/beta hydrolase [Lapidilactobacillus wuchangensis]|uniref:alpha/beta hydrolase n=1 Tax=Lapidilactobacillus wuchangensis TaxID=2486001 RepID=UPI000F7A8112|nr:alpha/beta fold hydrolase [Lapidilactobacillus wuchangensis]